MFDYDSLQCPKCTGRLAFIRPGDAYCEQCGYGAWCDTDLPEHPEWGRLPWGTFEAAQEETQPNA